MELSTNRRLVAGATALLIVLSACGGDDEEAKTDTGTAEEADADETTTTTGATRADCTVAALTEAAATQHADAVITEQSCSAGFGIALISASGLDESVAFFKDESGSWVFISTGAVDAATGDALPEGFSTTVWERWIQRQLAPSTPTPSASSTGGVGGDPSELDGNSVYENTTTTTAPPTTTTTAPPTASTEPQLDPYCIEFPEEPSCLENPYLQ